MPPVEPMPLPSRESFRAAPELAHEASYLAASAKISSLRVSSMRSNERLRIAHACRCSTFSYRFPEKTAAMQEEMRASLVHLHRHLTEALAVVVELHVLMVGQERHGHAAIHNALGDHQRGQALA